jgi:glycogen operon protein
LETLAFDPILAKCKLIAEAWDAGGLYQVGSFPAYGRWAEWNGKYRDSMRKFLKGDLGMMPEVTQRLQGSPDLYGMRGPTASVNFITAHDGFTLYDLVSYNDKHNEANGEDNRDGGNDNHSWNCGWEGETDDWGINVLRHRQIKNAAVLMMVSQGVPMIVMGDEAGRTQYGNNNAYNHDNELSWYDWGAVERNADLFRFFRHIIAFRHAHPVLRNRWFLTNQDRVGSGFADITWHGPKAWNADFSGTSRMIAFLLCGKNARGGSVQDNYLYVAINMHSEGQWFELPGLPDGLRWHVSANTGAPPPADIWDAGQEPLLDDQVGILLGDRSIVVLIGK